MRRLLALSLIAAFLFVACNGGSKHTGSTTTTDATAYATAYSVCQRFNNADVARNGEPQAMTDQQADLVFANLASELRPASRRDPAAWSKLQTVADRLQKELAGTSASDDQIESTITKMADACQAARKRPANLPTVPPTTGPSTTSTTATGA